eukprot:scaffold13326_cov127-Isochrysis_galbana.AAC.9
MSLSDMIAGPESSEGWVRFSGSVAVLREIPRRMGSSGRRPSATDGGKCRPAFVFFYSQPLHI